MVSLASDAADALQKTTVPL